MLSKRTDSVFVCHGESHQKFSSSSSAVIIVVVEDDWSYCAIWNLIDISASSSIIWNHPDSVNSPSTNPLSLPLSWLCYRPYSSVDSLGTLSQVSSDEAHIVAYGTDSAISCQSIRMFPAHTCASSSVCPSERVCHQMMGKARRWKWTIMDNSGHVKALFSEKSKMIGNMWTWS